MIAARILSFLMFQVGWLACAISGATAAPWLAAAIGLPVVVFNLTESPSPRRAAVLCAAGAALGPLTDGLLARAGMIGLEGPPLLGFWMPLWLVMLWAVFTSSLPVSFGWLAGRYRLAALCGAVFGPSSYWAGARIGAISLHDDLWPSMIAVGIQWTILCPLLVWLTERARGQSGGGELPVGVRGEI